MAADGAVAARTTIVQLAMSSLTPKDADRLLNTKGVLRVRHSLSPTCTGGDECGGVRRVGVGHMRSGGRRRGGTMSNRGWGPSASSAWREDPSSNRCQ